MKRVTWVTAFAYWIVGIPTSCIGMFTLNLALQGLWLGPTLAVFLNTVMYQTVITKADWQEISDDIRAKMKEDMKNIDIKD